MEMVATSKLKRAQDRVVAARPYARALAEVIGDLYSPDLAERFPLLRQPPSAARGGAGRRAAVLLITSNRGLAGAFNSNLIREARNLIASLEGVGTEIELHIIGRKGLGFFRFVGRAIASNRTDITDRPTMDDARSFVDPMMNDFVRGALDAV